MFRKILPYFLLLIICLPAVFSLTKPGFFQTDDGNWMVIRLAHFHQALRSGQFPVRFLPSLNHGYGYPVLDFLYPLPFYFGEAVHLLGAGFVNSVKILFAGSFIFGAIFMFLWIGQKWGSRAGMIAAVFYTYFPYRIYDVYKRGSLGEAAAFIFPPLIFYFLEKYFRDKKYRYLSLTAFLTAALILAHNVVALLFLMLILALLVYQAYHSADRRYFAIHNSLLFILILGTSAFFWQPALYDLQFTRALSVVVSNYSNYFLSSGNFLRLLGPLLPAAALLAIFRAGQKSNQLFKASLLMIFISVFFASPFADVFWRFPLLPKIVQFPWRFLSLTAFFGAVVVGYLTRTITRLPVIFVIIAVIIGLSGIFNLNLQPTYYPEGYFTTNDDTTTVKNEYMPMWVMADPIARPDWQFRIVSGKGSITDGNRLIALTPVSVVASQVYFPGQRLAVGNKSYSASADSDGLALFRLPAGNFDLKEIFQETPARIIADLVSLVSVLLGAVWLIRKD